MVMPRGIFSRLLLSGTVVLLDLCLLNSFSLGTQASINEFEGREDMSPSDVAEELERSSIPGVTRKIITDVSDGGHRLVEVLQYSKGAVLECNAAGSRNLIAIVLNLIPEEMVTKVTKDEMQYFLDLCDNRDERVQLGPMKSIFDFIGPTAKRRLIFPGTKWCGAGTMAKNYHDLGRAKDTDMCCRDHDHAADSLAPSETKYGITNSMKYTMTNCQDDCKFYNCLFKVNSLTSNAVGATFFDFLRTKCFSYSYPDKCASRKLAFLPWLGKSCKQYQPDTSKSRKWRILSQPGYSTSKRLRNCALYNYRRTSSRANW